MCISLSTGSRGLISPPKIYARPAITERECDERGSWMVLMRSHFALTGCVGLKRPRTAAATVAATSVAILTVSYGFDLNQSKSGGDSKNAERPFGTCEF